MTGNKHLNEKKKHSHLRLIILGCICALYLALALSYSWLTPAWEANDEADHVTYVEYIVKHHHPPPISLVNGHESHQPPLYYVILAGWQKILGAPSFTPNLIPGPNQTAIGPVQGKLALSHHYNHPQKQQAVWLHELRLVSVLFGLGTVILTFLIGEAVTKRIDIAAAASLFVALLPKFLVVNSVVTNDSLVIMLCSLLLYMSLTVYRKPERKQRLYGFLMGVVAGAAVLTKLNSFPVVVLLFGALIMYAIKKRGAAIYPPLLLAAGFFISCGWWMIYNWHRYGDPLAQKVSNDYLIKGIPGLIKPVPWLNADRFIHFLPVQLEKTSWYNGGWNQLIIPTWMNISLCALALISLMSALHFILKTHKTKNFPENYKYLCLGLAIFGGLIALLIIAKTTTQAEGRVTYVGLSAFAVLCVVGMRHLFSVASSSLQKLGLMIWPICFALLNAYILAHIIWPIHSL